MTGKCETVTAPKLKGRPRKKKRAIKRAGSPAESESASSESSLSAGPISSKVGPTYTWTTIRNILHNVQIFQNAMAKNGVKKDLISILSQKNTKEELDFLQKLISFMDKRKTPIERPPMLGFRQSKRRLKLYSEIIARSKFLVIFSRSPLVLYKSREARRLRRVHGQKVVEVHLRRTRRQPAKYERRNVYQEAL